MNLSPSFRPRFFDNVTGAPLAGGQVFTYLAGTSTPQTTYSNSTGTTNTNPVVLDANGYADIWLDPTLAYKIVLMDANSNLLWSVDQVTYTTGISTWNANATYQQGAIVLDTSGQGIFYVSLINNNSAYALTNPSAWRAYDGNIRTLSTASTLLVTDNLIRSNSTAGALTHTLPPCSTSPVGKRITVKDVGTGGYATTVKGSGSDLVDGNNTFGTALVGNQSVTFENNGTSWDALGFPADKSITQAKLAARATGTTVTAGGVAISATSGATAVTSVGTTTLSTVTITTTGRPVLWNLQPDPSLGSNFQLQYGSGLSSNSVSLVLTRDTTVIASWIVTMNAASGTNIRIGGSPSCPIIDPVGAGSHTYTLTCSGLTSGSELFFYYLQSVAYEL